MTTMIQTLDETAGAYTSKTRATNEYGSCRYFVDGKCCAVGRCLENPGRFADQLGSVNSFDNLESRLKPEYRGFPLAFWRLIQQLHDHSVHWDENGLSEVGKKEVERIKKWLNKEINDDQTNHPA